MVRMVFTSVWWRWFEDQTSAPTGERFTGLTYNRAVHLVEEAVWSCAVDSRNYETEKVKTGYLEIFGLTAVVLVTACIITLSAMFPSSCQVNFIQTREMLF